MDNTGHIGERIALYRNRRGLSQEVLAGMVGRSVSWLSQLERGERTVDKLSVLIPMAKALRIDLGDLLGEPVDFTPRSGPSLNAIDRIRAAMTDYLPAVDDGDEVPDLVLLRAVAVEIMSNYQAAEYDRAASLLPTTMQSIDTAAALTEGDQYREALSLRALIHQIAAALFSRTGLTDLGWVAADRSINAARQADDIELVTAGIYRLGQIMLRAGQNEQAYRLADTTMASTGDGEGTPSAMSLHGALLLTAAIAAARLDDRRESLKLLNQAHDIAERLGERNDHWTAFGPTNVQLHATSAAVSLNDPNDVITQGGMVNPDAFPNELRGRRSQVYIDLAWAYSRQRNDTATVLALMEAERLAPEAVRFNPAARDLIQASLHRSRKSAVPGLAALAERAGVSA